MNSQIVAAFTLTLRFACQKPTGEQELRRQSPFLLSRSVMQEVNVSFPLVARDAQRDSTMECLLIS
jgi:hypothetical protein